MTLLVRNEADVVRPWLDFHLAHGVDGIVAMDHGSTDGTSDILRDYARGGVLHYTFESAADCRQAAWVTAMARKAFREHDADWVINADADEFYCARHGTLKTTLNALPADTDVVTIRRNDMPPLAVPAGSEPLREMIYRKRVSRAFPLSHVILDKVIHRGFPDVRVATGAHNAASRYFRVQSPCEDIETLHYPVRSLTQFQEKVMAGVRAFPASGRYRLWHAALEAGTIAEAFAELCLKREAIASLLEAGELSIDRRVETFVSRTHGA